jgi:ABC-type dipeptide/oligopeptide/nickel transport system ATPase component
MNYAEPLPFFSVSLSVDYPRKAGVLRDLFLQIRRGEVLGLIGHSGSGKSTLALAALGLLDTKSATVHGSIHFEGRDLLKLSEREWRDLRGREIALVLQSPLTSLNPALRIGTQLREAWQAHSKAEWRQPAAEALESVSLPHDDDFLNRRPSQLSIGQAQRVLIAMAVLHRPKLIIADEPTSALDVITQSEVLALFAELNQKLGSSLLFISHDLLSVAAICDRIAIIHDGEIVETGDTERIFMRPQHPYTQQLIAALPALPTFKQARAASIVAT